ncbi:hypothetical protein BSKO_07458 [Bryopsis sp. KO-2023]|nr:hypothetical protein BSKO_07458 [Bryopsis sp. KO-2023]
MGNEHAGSYWVEGVSAASTILFENETDRPVELIWVDPQGQPIPYGSIRPQRRHLQDTFTTHKWRVVGEEGTILAEHVGETAKVFIRDEGASESQPWDMQAEIDALKTHPTWGQYTTRMQMRGIDILAFSIVSEEAVMRTHYVLSRMLGDSPVEVVERMVYNGSKVAIIGKKQKTSDIPEHHFVTLAGDRSIDHSTRGLGGTTINPLCSVGEENMLMEDDQSYPSENLLIHEMGHSVKTLGLSYEQKQRLTESYYRAYHGGTYDNSSYIMFDEEEYWAEGTQAWFEATIREDVTSGINTREKLKAHDPLLASLMVEAYGDGSWRYQDDSPAKFVLKGQPQILNGTPLPALYKSSLELKAPV